MRVVVARRDRRDHGGRAHRRPGGMNRAIRACGGAGPSDAFPLASMYAHLRTLRLAELPDKVHRRSIEPGQVGKVSS